MDLYCAQGRVCPRQGLPKAGFRPCLGLHLGNGWDSQAETVNKNGLTITNTGNSSTARKSLRKEGNMYTEWYLDNSVLCNMAKQCADAVIA